MFYTHTRQLNRNTQRDTQICTQGPHSPRYTETQVHQTLTETYWSQSDTNTDAYSHILLNRDIHLPSLTPTSHWSLRGGGGLSYTRPSPHLSLHPQGYDRSCPGLGTTVRGKGAPGDAGQGKGPEQQPCQEGFSSIGAPSALSAALDSVASVPHRCSPGAGPWRGRGEAGPCSAEGSAALLAPACSRPARLSVPPSPATRGSELIPPPTHHPPRPLPGPRAPEAAPSSRH